MISDADLKEFIAQWNTTSGVTILRADQSVKMPSYPYATYKELSTNVEPWVSNIKTRSYNPTDKIVTITENETSETTIATANVTMTVVNAYFNFIPTFSFR